MNICTHIYIYIDIYTLHEPNIAPENGGLEDRLPFERAMFSDASQSNSRASSSPCVSMKIVQFVSFLQAPPGYLSGYSPEN